MTAARLTPPTMFCGLCLGLFCLGGILYVVIQTKTMIGLNDKGQFRFQRPATGAGDVKKRRLPVVEKEDLSEWSEQSLNQVRWTPARIKELQRDYTGLKKEKDGHWYLGERRIVMEGDDIEPILEEEYRQVPPSVGYLRWMSILRQAYVGLKRNRVQAWLNNQEQKQKFRELKKRSNSKVIRPSAAGVRWTMDLGKLSEDGWYRNQKWTGLALIVDAFSKLVFARAVKNDSTAEAIRVLDEWLAYLEEIGAQNMPRALGTDNGSNFTSKEFEEYLKDKNVKHILGATYTPTSQGNVERMMRTFKGYLTASADAAGRASSWPAHIQQAMATINASWQRLLKGKTPFEILTGEKDEELAQRLRDQADQRRNTRFYVRQALEPGTPVRLSLRIVGTSQEKSALKSGIGRKGYQDNWGVDQVYIVDKRRGNFYKLKTKNGKTVEGSFDRSDILKLPTSDPASIYRREEPEPEERPAPVVRIRVKAAPKPAKPAYQGVHKALLGKIFKDKNITYKVTGIGKEKDQNGDLVDVAYYKRLLRSGKLQARRYYEVVEDVKAYRSIEPTE
jgi:transposase InsO family protein